MYANKHEKMLSIISRLQGNGSQNHDKLPLDTHEDGYNQRQ